jgi:hypothetical protein
MCDKFFVKGNFKKLVKKSRGVPQRILPSTSSTQVCMLLMLREVVVGRGWHEGAYRRKVLFPQQAPHEARAHGGTGALQTGRFDKRYPIGGE